MKKIFTLLTAALVTLTSFADLKDGTITILDKSRKQLWIEVDGYRYTNQGNRPLFIDNLRPGAHRIKVFSDRRFRDWDDVFGRGDRKRAIYNNTIYIKPFTSTYITIEHDGDVFVEEKRMNGRYDRDDRDRGRGWDDNNNRGRDDHDRDRNDNRGRDNNDWDRNGQNNNYDPRNDNDFDPRRSPMDAQSFEMLKRALMRENFEKSRLEIAKQSMDRNNFNAAQVRQLALLFAFEENKLDLAKFAYHRTVDKNNFFVVYDVFSFSRSKEELADYTRRF